MPDPKVSCGPYTPDVKLKDFQVSSTNEEKRPTKMKRDSHVNSFNHDTVGMVTIDRDGNVAAGTSTNGASFKIPGSVVLLC